MLISLSCLSVFVLWPNNKCEQLCVQLSVKFLTLQRPSLKCCTGVEFVPSCTLSVASTGAASEVVEFVPIWQLPIAPPRAAPEVLGLNTCGCTHWSHVPDGGASGAVDSDAPIERGDDAAHRGRALRHHDLLHAHPLRPALTPRTSRHRANGQEPAEGVRTPTGDRRTRKWAPGRLAPNQEATCEKS